jgi:hypothetical protein
MKALERQFEEEQKKIEELREEKEMTQEQDEDDQGNWEEHNEDDWSRWHHEDEHTEKDESSKESSFVVVSDGKRWRTHQKKKRKTHHEIQTSWKHSNWLLKAGKRH